MEIKGNRYLEEMKKLIGNPNEHRLLLAISKDSR